MRIVLVHIGRRFSAPSLRVLGEVLRRIGMQILYVFVDKYITYSDDTARQLASNILSLLPNIVGLSVFSDNARFARKLSKELKKCSDVIVVWGGPDVSIRPDNAVNSCDFAFIGEAECTFQRFCQAVSLGDNPKNLKSIAYLENEHIVVRKTDTIIQNLDVLPFPNWNFEGEYICCEHGLVQLTLETVEENLGGKYDILTSRGCPFRCSYCCNDYLKSLYPHRTPAVRRRSVKHVISELKHAINTLPHLEFVNFWDDCFVQDSDYLKEFCQRYKEEIGLPFYCLSRPEYLTSCTIELLLEAGMAAVQIGLQSADPKTRKIYCCDRFDASSFKDSISRLAKQDVYIIIDIIFNNPFESVESIKKTILFLNSLPKPFVINGWNLVFFPKTRIASYALKAGAIETKLHLGDDEDGQLTYCGINSVAYFPFNHIVPNEFYRTNYCCAELEKINALLSMTGIWPSWFISLCLKYIDLVPTRLLKAIWDNDVGIVSSIHRQHLRLVQIESLEELVKLEYKELAAGLISKLKISRVLTNQMRDRLLKLEQVTR